MKKITIIYIWLEEYRSFKNAEFNFSSKYNFHFDIEKNEITMEKNKDYIDNFFGENIDLTAIIGENGAGKTSLLELFMKFAHYEFDVNSSCILIYEDNKTFHIRIINSNKSKNNIELMNILVSQNCQKEILSSSRKLLPLEITRTIYTTETLNTSQFDMNDYMCFNNLSPASLLYSVGLGMDTSPVNDRLVKYIHRIFDMQIQFFANEKEYTKKFNINYPKYVSVKFSFIDDESLKKCYDYRSQITDTKIDVNSVEYFFLYDESILGKNLFRDKMSKAIFLNLFTSIYMVGSNDPSKLFNKIFNSLNKTMQTQQENTDFFKRLIYFLKQCGIFPSYLNLAKYLDKLTENTECFNFDEFFLIPTDKICITQSDLQTTISEFHTKYRKAINYIDFLQFSWGLSSGETLLLNIFSKLYSLTRQVKSERFLPEKEKDHTPCKNAIIMLDEAEVSFHPEWQRQYLSSLLDFIKKIFVESGTHIQLIIATHSPIILSDIPKQNTIYLKKDEYNSTIVDSNTNHSETFGANIFRLYNDSFFLKNGAVGVFADIKIINLLEMIDNYANEKKDDIQKRINIIGDHFLKHKINKMFLEKLSTPNKVLQIEEQIKDLQNQKKVLQKKADDLTGKNR